MKLLQQPEPPTQECYEVLAPTQDGRGFKRVAATLDPVRYYSGKDCIFRRLPDGMLFKVKDGVLVADACLSR